MLRASRCWHTVRFQSDGPRTLGAVAPDLCNFFSHPRNFWHVSEAGNLDFPLAYSEPRPLAKLILTTLTKKVESLAKVCGDDSLFSSARAKRWTRGLPAHGIPAMKVRVWDGELASEALIESGTRAHNQGRKLAAHSVAAN